MADLCSAPRSGVLVIAPKSSSGSTIALVKGIPWDPGEFDSLTLVDVDTANRRSGAAWFVAGSAFILILLATLAWATAGFVLGVRALPCQYHEAREGTGFEKLHGWRIEDVQQFSTLRLTVRTEIDTAAEPGTVLRISRCNVPPGADGVAYVAAAS